MLIRVVKINKKDYTPTQINIDPKFPAMTFPAYPAS